MRSSKLKKELSYLSERILQLEYEIQDIKEILTDKGENMYNSIKLVKPSIKKSRKKARKKARSSNSGSNSGLSSVGRRTSSVGRRTSSVGRRTSSVMPRSLSSLSSSRSSTYILPEIQPNYVYQETLGSAKNHQYGIRPEPSGRRSAGNNKKTKSVSRTRRTKSV